MRKLILTNRQSPGDIVMLTAAVRDLKRACPDWQIDVRTAAPALWENNPHLTPIADDDPDAEHIQCEYPLIHKSNQLPYHFIHAFRKFLEGKLGISIPQGPFRGDIHLSDEERSWTNQVEETFGYKGDFWILVAGGKFDFTAKWWSPASYQDVVNRLAGKVQFIQCGESKHWHPPLEKVFNLVGRTDLRQFVRLVYHAAGVICPVTMAMHLAAAVPTRPGRPPSRPCVVIAGGREPTHWEAYPTHQFLHTVGALPCCEAGGCWRSRCHKVGDGSPKDRRKLCEHPVEAGDVSIPRCMFLITPADVVRAVETYYRGGVLSHGIRLQARSQIAFAGMKRSGNHPILDWIISQTDGEICFLNNVSPGRNEIPPDAQTWPLPSLRRTRPVRALQGRLLGLVICSYEDVRPEEAAWMQGVESEQRLRVLVLRDPYNLLASTVGMAGRAGHWAMTHRPGETGAPRPEALRAWAGRWKEHAREYLRIAEAGNGEVAISYNRWLGDSAYRDELAGRLGLANRSDESMRSVPGHGGGSSFDRRRLDGRAGEGNYLARWKRFAGRPWFRGVFADDELAALSEQVFGHIEGTEQLKEIA